MQSERPVRDLSRDAYNFRVLPRHLRRIGLASGEEVEVQDTSDHVVLESRRGALGVIDLDIHTVRVH